MGQGPLVRGGRPAGKARVTSEVPCIDSRLSVAARFNAHPSLHAHHARAAPARRQVFFSMRSPLFRWKLPLLHKWLYVNGTW
jgi:hypothetical protein